MLRARRQSAISFPSDLRESHIPIPTALNVTYVAIKSIIGREDDDDDSHVQRQATNQSPSRAFAGDLLFANNTGDRRRESRKQTNICSLRLCTFHYGKVPRAYLRCFVIPFIRSNRNSREERKLQLTVSPAIISKSFILFIIFL